MVQIAKITLFGLCVMSGRTNNLADGAVKELRAAPVPETCRECASIVPGMCHWSRFEDEKASKNNAKSGSTWALNYLTI
jgi:hypothetical protein